jgi:hypothetical protein
MGNYSMSTGQVLSGIGGSTISGILGAGGGIGGAGGSGAGGAGGGGKSSIQSALNSLVAQRDDLLIQAEIFKTQTGLLQPSALQNFRANEAKFNITVNGAIDAESTARQIVSILNDSTARGTLGAGAFDR